MNKEQFIKLIVRMSKPQIIEHEGRDCDLFNQSEEVCEFLVGVLK